MFKIATLAKETKEISILLDIFDDKNKVRGKVKLFINPKIKNIFCLLRINGSEDNGATKNFTYNQKHNICAKYPAWAHFSPNIRLNNSTP